MTTLLAVDDEPAVLEDLRAILVWENLGIDRFLTATGSHEALEVISREPVDILLTDIRMPQMDGLELIERAREIRPNMRAVALSAHDEFEYVRSALRLGVENYILKPVSPAELHETIVAIRKELAVAETLTVARPYAAAEAFRQNVLQRWVEGSIDDMELDERVALAGVDLEARRFCVVLVTDLPSRPREDALSRASHLVETLRVRTQIAATNELHVEVFIDGDARPVLLWYGDAATVDANSIASCSAAAVETAARSGADGGWHVAVGSVVLDPSRVRESYDVARLLAGARYLWPERTVATPALTPTLAGEASPRESAAMVRFRHALENAHPDACLEVVRTQWDELRRHEPAERLSRIAPYLLAVIDRIVDRCRAKKPDSCDLLNHALAITDSRTYSELQSRAEAFVATAVGRLAQRDDEIPELVRYVLELVRRAFGEDLSLKTIAGQLNVNTSYLGQLLRTHTGELFHDYLTKVRMREAQALLIGSDAQVSAVARACGYPQQSYFNRVFKRTFGMTPVEYRRLARG